MGLEFDYVTYMFNIEFFDTRSSTSTLLEEGVVGTKEGNRLINLPVLHQKEKKEKH